MGEALSRLQNKGTWVDYVRSLVAKYQLQTCWFFKVENNSLELTRIFKENILTKCEREKRRRREIEKQRERKRTLSAFLCLFSAFSRAHIWSIYSLYKRVGMRGGMRKSGKRRLLIR